MAKLGARAADAMFWNLVGKTAFMVVKYAESIVLVRLLGGDDYGALSGLLNLNAMVVLFAALGLENTLLRFLPEAIARGGAAAEKKLVAQSSLIRLAVSALAGALLWILARPLAGLIVHNPEQAYLVKIVALMVIGLGFQNLMSRVLVARYEQRFINLIQAGLTAAYVALAALVVYLGGGVAGVLWCLTALYAITLLLFVYRLRRPNAMAGEIREPAAPISAGRLLRFSGYLYLYSVLHFAFEKGMDVLLLGALRDELIEVTWYVLAYNFAYFAVNFFSAAFSEGFTLAMIGEVVAQGDTQKLRAIFGVFMEYLYIFIFPIVIGGIIVGPDLMRLMYGQVAEGSIAPMIILFIGLAVSKMGGITANFLQGLDQEKALVKARLLFASVNLVLDLILIPFLGAVGPAIGTSVAVICGIAYEWRIVHRLIQPVYPWRFLAKTLGASLVMGFVVWWAGQHIHWHQLLRLPFLVLLGLVVFAVILVPLRPFRKQHAELLGTLPLPWKHVWLKWLTPK